MQGFLRWVFAVTVVAGCGLGKAPKASPDGGSDASVLDGSGFLDGLFPDALAADASPPDGGQRILACGPTTNFAREILATHPRIFIRSREAWSRVSDMFYEDSLLRIWGAALRQEAIDLLATSPLESWDDFPACGNCGRVALDRIYLFTVLGHVLHQTDPYRDIFLARARRELLGVAALWPTWAPRSQHLQRDEFAHAVAIGFDWLYDELVDNNQREPVRQALLQGALQKAIEDYEDLNVTGGAWWVRTDSNHNTVANGGIGLAAIALANEGEPYTDGANRALRYIFGLLPTGERASLLFGLRQYSGDGGYREGPDYWHYSTRYVAALFAAMESAMPSVSNSDCGFRMEPGLAETARFGKHMYGPTGLSFGFSDTRDGYSRESSPFLLWLARWYKDEQARSVQYQYIASRTAGTLRRFPDRLWRGALDLVAAAYDPKWSVGEVIEPIGGELSASFLSKGVASFRSAWEPDALWAATLGGVNEGTHTQLDIGTFVIAADGVDWAIDLGADNFEIPNYSDFPSYRQRTEGHNTLQFDDLQQKRGAISKMLSFADRAEHAFVSYDLSDAYSDVPGLKKVLRGLALPFGRSRHYILIQDDLTMETGLSAQVRWAMHTRTTLQSLTEQDRVVTLRGVDTEGEVRRAQLFLLKPTDSTFAFSPVPSASGLELGRSGISKVTVETSVGEQASIQVLFVPESALLFGATLDEARRCLSQVEPLPSMCPVTGESVLQRPVQDWL